MEIQDKIIDYLTRNRVSTTEVADALGKNGALPDIFPVNRGFYKAGAVKWVYAYDSSNYPVHEQIQDLAENQIILVEAFNCAGRAIFGELVSKYLLLYRQSKALVVDGMLRDAARLIKENWPIWCKGFTPLGCYNKKPNDMLDESLRRDHQSRYEGSIAVCDDCGVVVIPKEKISEDFLEDLIFIEEQEDIWFDRLDHYKENTFEIVCQKKYIKDRL